MSVSSRPGNRQSRGPRCSPFVAAGVPSVGIWTETERPRPRFLSGDERARGSGGYSGRSLLDGRSSTSSRLAGGAKQKGGRNLQLDHYDTWVPLSLGNAGQKHDVELSRESLAEFGRTARYMAPREAHRAEQLAKVRAQWSYARRLYLQFFLLPIIKVGLAWHPVRKFAKQAMDRATQARKWMAVERIAEHIKSLKREAFYALFERAARVVASVTIQTQLARPFVAKQRTKCRRHLLGAARKMHEAWTKGVRQKRRTHLTEKKRLQQVWGVLEGSLQTLTARKELLLMAEERESRKVKSGNGTGPAASGEYDRRTTIQQDGRSSRVTLQPSDSAADDGTLTDGTRPLHSPRTPEDALLL
ncbi:unnamed protein product, partial [Amoebophrya sp. A25]|eukprot:GSA25T00001936001.1